MIVGAGTAWGDETTTYVFGSRDWTAKVGEVDANWTSNKRASGYTAGQGTQITTSATGANATSPKTFSNVKEIVVTYCTNSKAGNGTIKVKVGNGTEKTFTVEAPSSGGTTLKTTTFTYNPLESGAVTLTVDCTKNSVYIYSIAIIEGASVDPSLEGSDLALSPTALTFDLYNNKAEKVINYTTSSTGAVTVSESDYVSTVVNQSAKTITVTPLKKTAETVEITVSQAADGTYAAGSATFTVDITDSTPKSGAWVVTTLDELTSDDVFVIVGYNGNYYAMSNDKSTSAAPTAVAVTIVDNEITSEVADNIKWNISGNSTDGYTFYPDGNTETWLYCTSSNNGVRVGTNTNKTFKIEDNYLCHKGTSRYVGVYQSQDWRCYTSINSNITGQTFAFYKYEDNSAVKAPVITVEEAFIGSTTATITCDTEGATIYYSFDNTNWTEYTEALTIIATTTIYAKAIKDEEESKVVSKTTTKMKAEPTVAISGDLTVDLNGETDVPAGTLTAAVTYNEAAVDGATVTWSGNNDDVATINATAGEVTIKSRGTVTFTATYAGNSDYAEATATKTITVIDSKAPGTEGRPYTVAEAIDAIDNSGDVNGVYATGIVSQIVTAYNSQYGNISYNISVDGTTEAAQLQAFRGKSYNGENFTSEDDIQVGDVVVIYGDLTKYDNTTYEFKQNNQLVSLTRKGDAGLSYETTAYYVTVGGTFDAPALTNPHDLTVTYSSSDTEVATVNAETGGVTLGSKVGTTTITASFAGNGEYNAASASYTLTVEYPATTTTLNETAVELDLADDVPTATLVATVKQGEEVIENATITWTSDNEEVATVDNNGVVTAVAKGTATITATFTADGYKTSTATCEVTVINSASGVIDLAKTGTISFSDFSNAGSYNKTEEEIFVVDGYDFAKFYCMKNSNELQMHAGDGYVILPTIKSTKGYSITVNYYNTGGEAPTLLVGDVTKATGSDGTIEYNSESISETVKILAGSKATYVTSITITPIKDNRTLAFSEPTTEILVNGTATNAATATPAATITYTSSDENVAIVDAEGKVTGKKIGTATITATVAEDADYNEATASYEVTVNGIPAATDIVLTATDGNEAPVALNEIEVGTIGTFAATYTKAADNVTVTYTSDATDVLTIDDNVFEAAKGGTANVTVTITPDDTEHYVAVSKVFEVTLLYAQKGTTELTIVNGEVEEQTSGSTLYGTNINLTAMLAANYDGTVTASLTNNAIANVAIEGENITITPKAVGTTTITFTAPATANFEGEVNKTYELTVTAPEGQTACEVIPAEVVLNETFSKCDSNGGNDGDFGTSSTTSISSPNSATDVEGWTLTTAYEADGCVKFGSSKNAGSATTPSLSVSEGKAYTLTFNAAPWNTESATMTVSVTGGTINGEGTVTTATMTTGEWNSFEYNILATSANMTIAFTCSQKRFFLDEVKVEIPEVAPAIPDVTIAESGYASFCCEYPLDFTEANENYKAWYVSEVSGTTVTFKQIKGKIAGGVPFILYGEKGTYHLQVAAEGTETLSGNMLVGTLAPTYVGSVVGDYTNFGLSEGSFKKMNAGVVKANKAYLPILTENVPAGARLNIIFDEGTSTGISSVNTDNLNKNNDVYNLNGQRVENMKKGGLYIVNGKKVFMKGQR